VRAVLVAVAGAAGALVRYGIASAVGSRGFPWATLAINVSGSFLLGLVLTVAQGRGWSPNLTTPVAVGFLGAYTTFSTFAWEGLDLGRDDRLGVAALYVAASVVLGLLAAAAGWGVGSLGRG